MEHDFLIIGGGVAGTSAAARLSDLGRVLLLEVEDHLAYHASGRSAATYEPGYGLPPVRALSLASAAYFDAAGVLSPRGIMIVAGASETVQFTADCDAMGIAAVSFDDARAVVPILNPETVHHVGIGDQAQDIDTDRLVQGFARAARANGATILTGARVTGIKKDSGWTVQTATDTHRARILVNAAGAWADHLAGLAGLTPLGLTPYRRSMARIPAPGGHDVRAWPMIFGAGETWYAKPDAGALIVSPADEDAVEPHDAWPEEMTLAEGIDRYCRMVTEPVTQMIGSWAGLRTFAPDRVLVIGPDPRDPSFVWLAGQGGYGMQTSPAASQLLADLIAGRDPVIDGEAVRALSPARLT